MKRVQTPGGAGPRDGLRTGTRVVSPTKGRAAKRVKGRTIDLDDGLFERIIVQAHRKDRTISEYVAALLERHVPDRRTVRVSVSNDDGAGA